jgi:hypothetical protein
MRTGMILAAVAVCAVATACTKKNSLYLEPGRAADAASAPAKTAPASHAPSSEAVAGVQKASQVESAER